MRLSSCGRKSRFRNNRNWGSKAGTHAMSWVGYAAAEFAPVVACAHKAAILVLRPTATTAASGAEGRHRADDQGRDCRHPRPNQLVAEAAAPYLALGLLCVVLLVTMGVPSLAVLGPMLLAASVNAH